MADVNPDVLAQMKRIWSAVNDGTVDKATINDALRLMHDILSGAAYEALPPVDPVEDAPSTHEEEEPEPVDEGEGEDHPHRRKARKKR